MKIRKEKEKQQQGKVQWYKLS